MNTYFINLPTELMHIILYKLDNYNDYDNLFQMIEFKNILNSGRFWNNIVKYTFNGKNINFNLLHPQYYKYFDNEYNNNLINYISLSHAYNYTDGIIKNGHIESDLYKNYKCIFYRLHNITNFSVLNLKYTKHIGIELENKIKKIYIDDLNDAVSSICVMISKKSYEFSIKRYNNNIKYEVSLDDVYNLILHITLNKGKKHL
jgi:hypothetical protein